MNRPAWSPDGQTIAAAVFDLGNQRHPAFSGRYTTGKAREVQSGPQLSLRWPQILKPRGSTISPADAPRRGSCASKALGSLARGRLAGFRTASNARLASYRYLSVDANRRVAIATRRSARASIWVGPSSGQELSEVVPESSANPMIGSVNNRGDVAYTADSFDRRRSGFSEAGRNRPRLVARGYSPAFLPSGDALVFLDQAPRAGLYRVNIDGSNKVRLAEGLASRPEVTPDGYVLFNANWSGETSLWQVPAAGGGTPELLRHGGDSWSISSDGRRVRITSGPAEQRTTIECDLPHCQVPQFRGRPDLFRSSLTAGRGQCDERRPLQL